MIVVAGPRIDSAGLPGYNGLKVRAYAPTCTGTWPPATWQSCKAVSPPAWNSSTPPAVSLLPPRSPLRADLPTSPTPRPLPSGPPDGLRRQRPPTPSPPRSAAPSTTVRSRPTAPPRCPPHRRTSVSTRLGAGPPPPVLAAQQQTTRPDTKASGPFQIGASRSHPSSLWLRSPPAREAMRSLTAVR
jgi:hypothetical protein